MVLGGVHVAHAVYRDNRRLMYRGNRARLKANHSSRGLESGRCAPTHWLGYIADTLKRRACDRAGLTWRLALVYKNAQVQVA